jgi:hypothetical protein
VIKTWENFCYHGTFVWRASRNFTWESEEKTKSLQRFCKNPSKSREEKVKKLKRMQDNLGNTYLTRKALHKVKARVQWAGSRSGLDQSLNPYYKS